MAFDRIVRTSFWTMPLALVVVAAFLDARAVSNLVGSVLSPPPAPRVFASLASQHRPLQAADAMPHEISAATLFARNPFDSQTGPLGAELPESTDVVDAPAGLADPMNAPACDGVKVLIITKADNPDWSFAAFSRRHGRRRRDREDRLAPAQR